MPVCKIRKTTPTLQNPHKEPGRMDPRQNYSPYQNQGHQGPHPNSGIGHGTEPGHQPHPGPCQHGNQSIGHGAAPMGGGQHRGNCPSGPHQHGKIGEGAGPGHHGNCPSGPHQHQHIGGGAGPNPNVSGPQYSAYGGGPAPPQPQPNYGGMGQGAGPNVIMPHQEIPQVPIGGGGIGHGAAPNSNQYNAYGQGGHGIGGGARPY
ncbi:hypothetical protein WR25_21207 [Diploscapter pachys]|uniref:Uncharacterized protein n=1 Tax=Diploscapter pachys TaxID=2018661 RepID=A0A2A2KXF2_9BILA|nr:hypothetical protein WR25_21207 [Diploscapter pachys]